MLSSRATREIAQSPGRPDRSQPADEAETADLARYIADMSAELAKLAGEAGLPMLNYFLHLARVEAEQQSQAKGGTRLGRDQY